ncbi:hypothetical protein TUM4445_41340 [Shewanella sp. MBTL60-112-B2]|nr:hypothetical protein TUM4445_41340 [Shewanella sp. MBTL60-112-B2]
MLMDEIGRGTSTYDGLSLAWSAAEYLAQRLGAMTLFATHYFELTQLAELMPQVANVHLDAMEHGDSIVFMHAVQEGAASKSYGLQVASLAGVPASVIKAAKLKLQQLESRDHGQDSNVPAQATLQLETPPSELELLLGRLNPDELSPREALDLIYKLKALAN